MSTASQQSQSASPPAPRASAPVIWTKTYQERHGPSRGWLIFTICVAASLVVHAALVGMLVLVDVRSTVAETTQLETAVIETKVDDASAEEKPPNLDNDELGMDPEVASGFDVNRIEEINVPGAVNAAEAVGIANAPVAAPANIPAPDGFGGTGQGGSIQMLAAGTGGLGLPGGMGGFKMVPGGFGGRSGATRQQLVHEGGGNAISEAAVARGLKWLAMHQAPEGHWSLDAFNRHGRCNCSGPGSNNDVAGTALALLPFFAAGETHKGGVGKNPQYTKMIERGLRYLLVQQTKEGAFNGDMYAQGLATIAVCEAYGLTSDPQLKGPAQRAIYNICRAQNDRGGWDYSPRGPTPDTSIGGWQLMALKSGQMSGLEVPTKTFALANAWLNDWAGDPEGSLYGYRQPRNMNPSEGGASPQAMVAIGLLCRQYLGWGPRNPGLVKGAKWMTQPENMPLMQNRRHMYFWYYATQFMHHMGGTSWSKWNPNMRDLLVKTQDQGQDPKFPHQKGSWDGKVDWWCAPGGRIMMTSLCLLTLEVYYRHLPLYRRDMGTTK